MNKTLALISVLGLAFLVGCGDDDSSSSSSGGTYSCTMDTDFMGITSSVCYETAASNIDDEDKAQCVGSEDVGVVATAGTGCASGATLSCTETEGGLSMTTHFYGDMYKEMTCEDLAGSAE